MSRRQLVDAYLAGKLSRRVFIKKLVKTGVAVGSAVTFASVIGPASAKLPNWGHNPDHDFYTGPHHPKKPKGVNKK